MSLTPETTHVIAASNVASVLSLILLEIGLRVKSRQAWSMVSGCAALLLVWTLYCWIAYAIEVWEAETAPGYHLIGPTKGQLVWMAVGPYFWAAIIPALVIRSLWSRRRAA
jgi:hypothetical protein